MLAAKDSKVEFFLSFKNVVHIFVQVKIQYYVDC